MKREKLMSSRYVQVWFLACYMLIAMASALAEDKGLDVSVVLASGVGDKPILRIVVQNRSNSTLYLHEGNLPWSTSTGGMKLFAMRGENREVQLEQLFAFDNPVDHIVVKPGSSIKGEIELAERFPSLQQERLTAEIVLFWTHNSIAFMDKALRNRVQHRDGGMLVIPKRTKFL